jgi:hypothetical protein
MTWRRSVASVMGLLEERETAARVRVEALQAEADRILEELGEAQAVLERRVIAVAELAEALSAPGGMSDAVEPALRESEGAPPASSGKVPAARSIVPHRREGMLVSALGPDYRRIVELVEAEPTAGADGISAKEIAARFGLELVPAKIEGVRSRAKRLADRDWLAASPTGRFTPRASSSPAATG